MKAITLWDPWASAMALELKRNETRGWSTPYRGPLAIHAAKRPIRESDGVDDLVRRLGEPIPFVGKQGFFDVPDELIAGALR